MDDRRPGTAICIDPGVVPPPTPAVALEGTGTCYWAHLLLQCYAYAYGENKSLEAGGALVEEELKWKWLR